MLLYGSPSPSKVSSICSDVMSIFLIAISLSLAASPLLNRLSGARPTAALDVLDSFDMGFRRISLTQVNPIE